MGRGKPGTFTAAGNPWGSAPSSHFSCGFYPAQFWWCYPNFTWYTFKKYSTTSYWVPTLFTALFYKGTTKCVWVSRKCTCAKLGSKEEFNRTRLQAAGCKRIASRSDMIKPKLILQTELCGEKVKTQHLSGTGRLSREAGKWFGPYIV